MNHDIVKDGEKFRCRVCNWSWKSKPGTSCPGVTRYEWQGAPANLKTEAQLRKVYLKPGPRRGIVKTRRMTEWLYDVNEVIPFTDEETRDAKERARKARYRTCKKCKKEVRREKWDSEWKACDACRPDLIKDYYRQQAIEEAIREEEHQKFLDENRAAAQEEARLWLALGKQAVILDTETTGLDYDAEVVQIGLIDLQGNVLMDCLVHPQKPIPDDAMRIHGITNEMVATAPGFEEVHHKLYGLLDGKLVITYNAAYDKRVILQSAKQCGCALDQLIVRDWVCAMEMYAQYVGEWSEYHGSFRWQKLPAGDHSAVGDCQATLAIIHKMAG